MVCFDGDADAKDVDVDGLARQRLETDCSQKDLEQPEKRKPFF
jgi:hypothetical protein